MFVFSNEFIVAFYPASTLQETSLLTSLSIFFRLGFFIFFIKNYQNYQFSYTGSPRYLYAVFLSMISRICDPEIAYFLEPIL